MKSLQFRSIAPKAPAVAPSPSPAPSPAVLACPPPSAPPEASAASTPKSIIVPTQNYALMQIAGQDGTFSLVALPPSVSSPSPPQAPPLHKNLKLPIPRYQPVRSKATPEKAKSASPAARPRAAPTSQAKPGPGAGSAAVKNPQEPKPVPKEAPVPKEEPSEQLIFIDPAAAADLSVAALLPDNAVLYPGPQPDRPPDASDRPAPSGLIQNLQYPPAALKTPRGQSPSEESKVRRGPSAPSSAPSGITVLSPAIFSKAVQIIPPPPTGKLPILPYCRVKSLPAAAAPEKSSGPAASKTRDGTETSGYHPVPSSALRPPTGAAPPPAPGTPLKPPGKKRGRKRKTVEDVLAFEARRKRSLSFFRRRAPEKPAAAVAGSKPEEVDISKKYRSIRPKPLLLMETLPRLLAVAPDAQDRELLLGPRLPAPAAPETAEGPSQAVAHLHLRGSSHSRVFAGSRPAHRCPTCGRCFQFKHHLQSHLNSHTQSRPHVCPFCRKAYAHSGSLSTHTKLHHGEARPRRALRCEFCHKAFGYVGVYFSHLREVHKVLLTVEPSVSHHEDRPSPGGNSPDPSDEPDREDPVELQIKCGRCQAVTPTFADMKMHLLHVHGEDVHVRPQDGAAPRGGREAEDELVKHAAHYWRQLNERRSLVKCGSCDEEFVSFSKLKRHILSHHRGREDGGGGGLSVLAAGAAFNCVLCSAVLDSRQQVTEHWRRSHHCEQPGLLWDALSSFSGLEDGDLDTPAPSPR